jgi:hypothetical protein
VTLAKLDLGVEATTGDTVASLPGDLIPPSSDLVFKPTKDGLPIGLGPTRFPSRSERGDRIVELSEDMDSLYSDEMDCWRIATFGVGGSFSRSSP